jgi:signal transduction histidine kinase
MLILGGLIWQTAREINRTDEARERTEHALSTEHRARVEADTARARAEDAERRLAIIAEASQLLASSLDARVLLERLAWLTVPALADWCFIDLVEENGAWQRVAIAYANPAHHDLAAQFRRHFREHGAKWYGEMGTALKEPATHNVPHVTDALLRGIAQDGEHLALLRELQLRSYVSVPLTIRNRVAGTITLVCDATSNRPPYSPAAIALVEELARRCSMAVDNARLYQGALSGAQTKVEFLATISHELRTPLTAIVGYTALLEEEIFGPMTKTQEEQLGHIHRSADHLLELIDDILTFSKLEAGRVSVSNESVIVADALEEAAGLVKPLATQRGLELVVERPENFAIVETDATKLRQILVNLLTNAAKFTERGSIRLRAWVDGPSIIFEVKDTGVGIAPEDTGRVFEAFTQLDQRLTRTVGGLGLGLGVAQRLAAVLGGEITLASRLGHGSTFFVRLPYPAPIQSHERGAVQALGA